VKKGGRRKEKDPRKREYEYFLQKKLLSPYLKRKILLKYYKNNITVFLNSFLDNWGGQKYLADKINKNKSQLG
jgi:predicted transcriptional regulator